MKKSDPQIARLALSFDENGTKEVSEQIMNAYNSGFFESAAAPADTESAQMEGGTQ
jgi:hypothetical protein